MFHPNYKRAITCSYLNFYDPRLKRNFRLPLVHIRIKHAETVFRTDALVDSGATGTFLPAELVDVLGIPLPKETSSALGAGGEFSTHVTKIDLIQILKGTNSFCEFENKTVSVPTSAGKIPHVVLGRDSIFQCYDITFREKQEKTVYRRPKG